MGLDNLVSTSSCGSVSSPVCPHHPWSDVQNRCPRLLCALPPYFLRREIPSLSEESCSVGVDGRLLFLVCRMDFFPMLRSPNAGCLIRWSLSALSKNSASFVYVIVMPGSPSLWKVATSDVAKQSRGRCNVLVVLVADPSDDRKSYKC